MEFMLKPNASRRIIGIDFTSRPTRAKPITIAVGMLNEQSSTLTIDEIVRCENMPICQATLEHLTPWIGAFDLPFGLPRDFVAEQGWLQNKTSATTWRQITDIVLKHTRAELVTRCKAYCDARPAGHKFAHRAVDRLAGSSPSMKWVNPPVLYMLHAGLPLLLVLDCLLPGLTEIGNPNRVALEAYPGFIARQITRNSYKSDDRQKQTSAREEARHMIVSALSQRHISTNIALKSSRALMQQMIADASGDSLDAAICALQAAMGVMKGAPHFGMPADVDPIEGWIVGV
jgi:Protein of unknown function (DUF429)